jgi:hypothetical protein
MAITGAFELARCHGAVLRSNLRSCERSAYSTSCADKCKELYFSRLLSIFRDEGGSVMVRWTIRTHGLARQVWKGLFGRSQTSSFCVHVPPPVRLNVYLQPACDHHSGKSQLSVINWFLPTLDVQLCIFRRDSSAKPNPSLLL